MMMSAQKIVEQLYIWQYMCPSNVFFYILDAVQNTECDSYTL